MIGNNINKNEYLISDANRLRARIGENFASLQQVSSRKLTPENLNKHLKETIDLQIMFLTLSSH